MAESNTFTGVTSSVQFRDEYQRLTSVDAFSKIVQFAIFNKTPFMQAVGLEAFGVAAVTDLDAFGAAQPTGRMIRFDSGKYAVAGAVWETAPSTKHVGRLGNFGPQLTEGGDEWIYSWHRLISVQFIPDVDVQDNGSGRVFDIKALKMDAMKQAYVRDFNLAILGNSSAPDAGVLGPSAVNHDLTKLIAVTQTGTVGGIDRTSTSGSDSISYWQNGVKDFSGGIGGGGEFDRPIILRRGLLDQMNDQLTFAEASNDFLLLASQGAWQIYDRLSYADSHIGGKGGAFGTNAKYDAAGIPNFSFNGNPMVWDPAVTIPSGATGSTESIYAIHIPSYFIALRTEENFKLLDWEAPRNHDLQRTLISQLLTRYTPMVTAMRPHFVAHDIPAAGD